VINILKGRDNTAMNYHYVATIKGKPLDNQPDVYQYDIDNALLSDVEIWQLQVSSSNGS